MNGLSFRKLKQGRTGVEFQGYSNIAIAEQNKIVSV